MNLSPTKMDRTKSIDANFVVSGKSFRRSKTKKSYLDSGPSQEQIDRRNLVKQKLDGMYGDFGGIGEDDEEDYYLKPQVAPPQLPPPPPCNSDSTHSRGSTGGFSPSIGLLRRKSTTPRTQKGRSKSFDADEVKISRSPDASNFENNKKMMKKKKSDGMSISDHGTRGKARDWMPLTRAPPANFNNSTSSNNSSSNSPCQSIRRSASPDVKTEYESPPSKGEKFVPRSPERRAPRRIKSMGTQRLGGYRNSPKGNKKTNATNGDMRQQYGDGTDSSFRKSPTKSFSWGGKGLRPLRRSSNADNCVPRGPVPYAPKLLGTDRDRDRDLSDTEETTTNSSGSSRSTININVPMKNSSPVSLHKEDIYNNALRRAQERQSKKCERQESPSFGSSLFPANRTLKPKRAKECDDYGFVSASDDSDDDDDTYKRTTSRKSSGGPPPPSSVEPSIFQRGLLALEQLYDDLNI